MGSNQGHLCHNYVGNEIIVLSTDTAMTAPTCLAFNVHEDEREIWTLMPRAHLHDKPSRKSFVRLFFRSYLVEVTGSIILCGNYGVYVAVTRLYLTPFRQAPRIRHNCHVDPVTATW